MTPRTRVLFLCTGNACRSQMAEGWLRHLAGDRFDVVSAGTQPHGVDPRAVRAMAELGIDISGHTSDTLESLLTPAPDLVIAVCDRAAECCPPLPDVTECVCWAFPDPAAAEGTEAQVADEFRRIRDVIRARIESWLEAGAPLEAAAAGRPISRR